MEKTVITLPIKDGAWLRHWMANRRYSQTILAKKLGVTTQTVRNYRKYLRVLPKRVLLVLSAIDAMDVVVIAEMQKNRG